MEGRHYAGTSIMDAAKKAADDLTCSVDDLDYEVISEEEEREFTGPDDLFEIIVYGLLESSTSFENTKSLPKKDPSTLTEEEFDFIADRTTETIREILSFFGAEDSEIDEYEGDDGEIILDIVGSDLAYLIGRHGKTLDSLQFLVTSITNKKLGYRIPVTIDVEGYKNKRREKIRNIAFKSASKALKNKSEVKLRPMTPYERRIVHLTLKNNEKVETFSEGLDPDRYIVIKPL